MVSKLQLTHYTKPEAISQVTEVELAKDLSYYLKSVISINAKNALN